MALGVSDEIIVSYVNQPARWLWPEEQPRHPNVEIVFSEDVAVAEVAHVDAFAVEIPRHVEAYERWYDIPRVREAIEISILEGGVVETVFIDKYDCPWHAAITDLWQPIIEWRSCEHAIAFVGDEAYVADTFLIWYMPDGARHLQALQNAEVLAWLSTITQEQSGVEAPASVVTHAVAITTIPLGNIHYTGGRLVLP